MTTEPSPAAEDDLLKIPDFLRVQNRRKTEATTPGVAVKFLDAWEEALNRVEPESFRLYLRDMMRRGRFARQWLVPDGTRRSEKDVEDTLAHWRAKLTEHENRAKESKQKRHAKKDVASDSSAVIIFEGDNPKKAGTAPHKRWELLRTHSDKTVAEFLEAGGNPTTLKNAVAGGYVILKTNGESEDGSEPDGAEDRGREDRGEEARGEEAEGEEHGGAGRRGRREDHARKGGGRAKEGRAKKVHRKR